VTDLADRLQELAEGAAREVRPPGADLARRRGRRRRRRLVAGVAVAAVLAAGLALEGPLADWSTPVPPIGPAPDVEWSTPRELKLDVDVANGRLPGAGTWRLQAGRFDRPTPDGTREVVGHLVVAAPGRREVFADGTFFEPGRLGAETGLTDLNNPTEIAALPVRPVFGMVSRRAARVVVVPRRGPAVLSPIRAELLNDRPGLPGRFWIAFLPAGGTPPQAVHQVRSYDADGRELCRLDPDSLTPSCRG
jgi:hypothetical protein